ncbi:MAG TPA: hypothetical protein VGY57_04110 [Vicinamibacterales bacterium]|nr:hypothetical protein [Vicinamibacterales bacterium]
MRKAVLVVSALILSLLVPSTAHAWGSNAHRYIMRRAIELLPTSIRPFFEAHRDELVMRVVDPDLWRTLGWDEDQNHFLDLGVREYGDYPFTALPHGYDEAVSKFGVATVKKNGLLPWRFAEEFGNLRRAMQGNGRGSGFAAGNVVLFTAVAAHYIQDGSQPLHASDNFDGAMTGQSGIHGRFESALFDRFESRLTVTPPAVKPIVNARETAFDQLLSGNRLVGTILAADKAAVAGKEFYDDGYFEKFFAGAQTVLEQRLAESISATAGLIVGAWEQAGRPNLTATSPPRQPQRVGGRGGL